MTKTTKSAAETQRNKAAATRAAMPPRKPATKRSSPPAPKTQTQPARSATNTGTNAPPKKTLIADLLRRQTGASLAELMTATGWQSHSIRATMTGFRKAGHAIIRHKDEGGTSVFRIVAES